MAEVRRLMRSWVTLRGTLARSRCRVVNVVVLKMQSTQLMVDGL